MRKFSVPSPTGAKRIKALLILGFAASAFGGSAAAGYGADGAYVQLTAPADIATLCYYGLNHSGMGGTITIPERAPGLYVVPMN